LLKKATYTTYQQASYRSVATVMKGFQDKFLGVGTSLANSLRMPGAFTTGKATVTSGGIASNGIYASATSKAKVGNYKLTVHQIAKKDQYTAIGNGKFEPTVSGEMTAKDFVRKIAASGGDLNVEVEDAPTINAFIDRYGDKFEKTGENVEYTVGDLVKALKSDVTARDKKISERDALDRQIRNLEAEKASLVEQKGKTGITNDEIAKIDDEIAKIDDKLGVYAIDDDPESEDDIPREATKLYLKRDELDTEIESLTGVVDDFAAKIDAVTGKDNGQGFYVDKADGNLYKYEFGDFTLNVSLDGAAAKSITIKKADIAGMFGFYDLDTANAKAVFDADGIDPTYDNKIDDQYDVDGVPTTADITSLQEKINNELERLFGTVTGPDGKPLTGTDAKAKVTATIEDGSIEFNAEVGHALKVSSNVAKMENGGESSETKSKTLGDLGLTLTGDELELQVNGTKVTIMKDEGKTLAEKTLDDVINQINKETNVSLYFDKDKGVFILEGDNTGAVNTLDVAGMNEGATMAFFNALGFSNTYKVPVLDGDGLPVLDGDGVPTTETKTNAFGNTNRDSTASDAVVQMDGKDITTRETNSFTIDGIDIRLDSNSVYYYTGDDPDTTGITEEAGDAKAKTFDINIASDVTALKDKIVEFVNEYNKMVKALNDLYTTARPKSSTGDYYEPLTDEEKKAMSESQIKEWEEQAKKGVLNRDDIIGKALSTLRTQMMKALDLGNGTSISLMSIGITTTSAIGDGGQLQINEEKLVKALEERPDDVKELFTRSASGGTRGSGDRYASEGITERLNDIIELTVGRGGTITKKAGVEWDSLSDKSNAIYRDLKNQNEKIAQMLKYLQDKEDYYYRMFSKMESAMMKAESQMSQMTGILGGA
jgi:flagellar hook-associated protein 2